MDGKISKKYYRTDYLFIKPKHLIYSHFPENVSHQLLTSPISAAQFGVLPPLNPKFFLIVKNPSANLKKKNHVSNRTSFEYSLKDGYYLRFIVKEMKNDIEIELKNRVFILTKGARHIAHFSFPSAGYYKVNIFYHEVGELKSFGCGEFIYIASTGSRTEFPIPFSSTAKNLEIMSPIEMPLKKGKLYTFSVKIENKSNVAIIHGKNFIELTKRKDDFFYKDYVIPKDINELKLGIADIDKNSYEIILKYHVE